MEASLSNRKLISIITASNRPHHMSAFLENLNATASDPLSLEVLVKIDVGDDAMYSLMEESIDRYSFEIRYIQMPKLDGYYTLHYGYQHLLEISDSETYFVFPVNEEVRFKTLGWDRVLRKYIGFFHDDVFRLKISRLKFRNYYSYHDCGPTPENYPILTRKWLELAEGIGDCWGPDGWHQFIDYYLGRCPGLGGIPGLFRSVPIIDILIDGEEAGKELTARQVKKRTQRICQEWWRMYSPAMQHRFKRLATKMFCYIWAKNEKLDQFEIVEQKENNFYQIIHDDEILTEYSFFLSPLYIRFKNFGFLMSKVRHNHFLFLKTFILHAEVSRNAIWKYIDYTIRTLVVMLAIVMAFFTKNDQDTLSLLQRIKDLLKKILITSFGEVHGKKIILILKNNRINQAIQFIKARRRGKNAI